MTTVPCLFFPVPATVPDAPSGPTAGDQALPHIACLGLGSNLGDSLRILQRAWTLLQEEPSIQAVRWSAPYHSDPLNMRSAHRFVNAAALVRTGLTPLALLERLLHLESRCGRSRFPAGATGYRDRTLDIDLLLFDDRIMRTDHLILPHPRMHERLFVLAPLAEIAPAFVHPVLRRPIADLLQDLRQTDPGQRVERTRWPDPVNAVPPPA